MNLFLQITAIDIRQIINYFRIILFLLAGTGFAEMHIGQLNQNNDRGFWLEQNIHVTLDKNWFITHNTTQRFGDDYKRLWFFKQWGTIHYDLTSVLKNWLCIANNSAFDSASIGLGFAKAWSIQRNTRDFPHWANTNRPNIVAFMTHKWKGWTLKQRMVCEYVSYVTKHYRSYAYYRHRAFFSTPWKFTCLNLNPFISNEWFFRAETMDGNEIVQTGFYHENRLRIGMSAEIFKPFKTEFWWQYKSNKQPPGSHPLWRKTYQVGMTLNINL